MSRIEQALRRANVGPAPAAGHDEVFDSAWPLESAAPAATRAEATPDLPAIDRPAPGVTQLLGGPVDTGVLGLAESWHDRLATEGGHAGLLEEFTRLAATLYHAQAENGLRSVMVTSALPGDGKTMTALNLALVLSESYHKRVLLIDADLRNPSIGKGALGRKGLSEALASTTDEKLTLTAITSRLTLLPAGRPVADPIAGLTSQRMKRILEEAVQRFDWVIVDAPPIGPVSDAGLLAAMVHGTLLVIRAGVTQSAAVERAVTSLGRERLLGVVLNGGEAAPHDSYYRYAAEPLNQASSKG